jgi:DNA-binding response OmpR family regulator
MKKLSDKGENTFDLVFDSISNSVVERKKGKIDFKNQFILLDMLKLFLRNPGEVYSKEALVKAVWRQDYDPAVHDNKIYVTIKRLRQLIEPDFDKPKYIYRAKNGYYLNRNAKISLEQ